MSRAKQLIDLLEAASANPNLARIDSLKQQIASDNKKIADLRAQHDTQSRAPGKSAQSDQFHNEITRVIQHKQGLHDELHRLQAAH